MKILLIISSMIICHLSIYSQEVIPAIIKGELTLKPSTKPYESSGFTLEKGATLTILPGTRIKLASGPDKYCNIVLKGTIIIGDKAASKSKPVIFEGYSPWIKFIGATIDITNLQATIVNCQFQGDNSGVIRNSILSRDQRQIPYPFIVTVPSKGNLTITECLIEDQGIEIKPSDFPNDIPNFTLTKCAFTFTPNQQKEGFFYKKCTINIYSFIYGSQCDSYANISFTAFDWKLAESISKEWYISDATQRKTLEDSCKAVKNFNLKLEKKTFTTFKQAPEPVQKKEVKK